MIARALRTLATASVIVACIMTFSTGSVSAGADGDDLFSQIYAKGTAKQKTLQSIRARFTETTTSTLLTTPIVAHGTLVGAPPARVVMTYTDPEPKTIAIDGQTLTIVWPERRERQQIKIADTQKRIDQYFGKASVKDLQSMFRIAAMPDDKIRTADRIEMQPTRKQISQGLSRLVLWVDRESAMLVQMRMVFPSGDEKTITLDGVTLNVPVTDATFRIEP